MTPFVEGVTQTAVVFFYAAAFTMALVAHYHSKLWARKISTIGIMFAAVGWLFFYLVIAQNCCDTASNKVLWSRAFHYNTATWLFIMAFVIRRADKYGIERILRNGLE